MAITPRKARHRKRRRHLKKIALAGAATVTATALAGGMAPPATTHPRIADVALAADSTGPDYTTIIGNASNTLDNLSVAQANLISAIASVWDPLAKVSGGLLPTFDASATGSDLTTTEIVEFVSDTLGALSSVDLSDLSGLLTSIVVGGVSVPLSTLLDSELSSTLSDLDVSGLLTFLSNELGTTASVLDGVAGSELDGVLADLVSGDLGITGTGSTYASSFDWSLLGLHEDTSVVNVLAKVPSLDLDSLTGILSNVLGSQGLDSLLSALGVGNLNGLISTPSLTVWVPLAEGTYSLLGGSAEFLATMPTVDIGAINSTLLDGLGLSDLIGSDTDTVLAVPLFAGDITLPLNLASWDHVMTGVVLPTATGVSIIGGTSVDSLKLLDIVGLTSVNTGSAFYIGTNGLNINTGQTVLTLSTPFGDYPITFSLGTFNIGASGFGFTGPSIGGVGLVPSIQIGTAPEQESNDGVIPASAMNAALEVPTQASSLYEDLGLSDVQNIIDALVNPVYKSTVGALGREVTTALNSSVGTIVNGMSALAEQVSAYLARLSAYLPGASSTTSTTASDTTVSTATSAAATTQRAATVSDDDTESHVAAGDAADHWQSSTSATTHSRSSGADSVGKSVGAEGATSSSEATADPTPTKDTTVRHAKSGRGTGTKTSNGTSDKGSSAARNHAHAKTA